MDILSEKRCIIGEGPIWNAEKGLVYFVNGYENEILISDVKTKALTVKKLPAPLTGVAAVAFGKNDDLIVSRDNGVFILRDEEYIPLYDTEKYPIRWANDMKVGPDGRIYVGTLSEKKRGISDKIDGKFYSIDTNGNVRELLDGIQVSNGMAWSMDEKRFYYTDSDTKIIKEYAFDKSTGDITYTGREVHVPGVDGFTIDEDDRLFVGCWGKGRVSVVDTKKMEILYHVDVPARIPTSCAFAGENMDELVVVSATYGIPENEWGFDGMTFIHRPGAKGKAPYIFDSDKIT